MEATEGPVLVLSGAGTGKTRVLTTRLAHIIASGLAAPWQVLAVTFTNRAAREMKDRLTAMIGPATEQIWLGTFHAVALRMLRRQPDCVALRPNFTVLDADDQLRLLKQIVQDDGLDPKRHSVQGLMAMVQRWKDRGLTPDQVTPEPAEPLPAARLITLYRRYQERLLALNAVDFGDLLLHALTLFKTHPDVLTDHQNRFRYILVDEYQDSNVAQYLWLRLLARPRYNICCVGDDDQAIYSWRGAEVDNILRFEKDFPNARVIRLERNYRSRPHILKAASGLIEHNKNRLGKALFSGVSAGEETPWEESREKKVLVRGVWNDLREAEVVVEEIDSDHLRGRSFNQMAILVRASFQTRMFEERLIVLAIPYRIIGGVRFYERQEIRDAIAYLRVIVQPDDDLAFERILNVPKRGLGPATVRALHVLARAEGGSLQAAAERLLTTPKTARASLRTLMESLAAWRIAATILPPAGLVARVLEESGYTAMLWHAEHTPDAPTRLENLKELVRAVGGFEDLVEFLEHVSLVMEIDPGAEDDRVTLMTLHAAKGLEFDAVFLPGWEEGLFPHQRALDGGGAKALEEERRLAYVGLTRARHKVMISFAANRRVYNQILSAIPSRFLDEIPPDAVERHSDSGVYAGPRRPRRIGT